MPGPGTRPSSHGPAPGAIWVEKLIALEAAKKDALLTFDAARYEEITTEEAGFVEAGVPDPTGIAADRALALAESIRLNSALLLNLVSVSPEFALSGRGYGPDGVADNLPRRRVRVRFEA